ncbi:DNA-binding protein [Corynebacterium sp.]|uniref:DNA-binding protein n=1 Tax=Corynebacterium sp. TaxID=1720 RepID=UPI0026E0D9FA|nr:DNA-binding protein [Corynebacterium sp.]MDO5512693.1 DNA-binding protein [Corynebacterium sp.]
METVTMNQIAELAGVRRPVVSVWRSRFADSPQPFPQPLDAPTLLFDAAEVGRWLDSTGRGNNSEARADAVMFSTLLESAATRLSAASALLLLHALSGEPLSGQDPDDLLMLLAGRGLESVLPPGEAATALDDDELVRSIDRLAEAGTTASRVLDRLVRRHESADGRLAAETLTEKGDRLMCAMIAELARDSDRVLVPRGPGGLRLIVRVVESIAEGERPRVGIASDPETPEERLLWRYLVSLGARLEALPPGADALLVGQWSAVGEEHTDRCFDQIDDAILDLSGRSAAVVIAPARLLTDERRGDEHRGRILGGGSSGYSAPLRYVARLPQGMCRFGGRRRLALWVLGTPVEQELRDFTTYGEHSGHALDAAECRAVGSDAVAALRGGEARRSHAFLRSAHRATDVFATQPALTLPVSDVALDDGGDALARLWERRDACPTDLLAGIDVVSGGAAEDASLSWKDATSGADRPARVITGVRIPAEVFAAGPGGIGVIGPDEVRGCAPVGERSVELVRLVEKVPRFRLTEPGDVVFTATSEAAAMIDAIGGHVVQAPARILRRLEPAEGGVRILPETAMRDIVAARGSDCRSWRLRTVVADAASPWRAVAARAAERRAQLLAELDALDALTTELSDGLAARTLRATFTEENA